MKNASREFVVSVSWPRRHNQSQKFDQLTGVFNQLLPEYRKTLADLFASIRPNIDQLLDKALAIPGVATIIKPTVDTIRAKLDTLTKVWDSDPKFLVR